MSSDSATLSLRRESLLSASGNVVIILLSFIIVAALARALGVSGMGVYYFMIATVSLIGNPLYRVSDLLRKRCSEVGARWEKYLGAWVIILVGYLALVALGVSLGGDLLASQTPFIPGAVGLTVVLIGSKNVFNTGRRMYEATGNVGTSVWAFAAREGLFIIALAGLMFYDATPRLVLLAYAGVSLFVGVGMLAIIGVIPRMPSRDTWNSIWTYGRWNIPAGLLKTLAGKMPVFALGYFVGSSAVGLYEAAFRLTELGPLIALSVNDALLVKTSGKSSQGQEVGSDISRALVLTGVLAIPIMFLMVVLAEPLLVTVFTSEFVAATTVLILITLARIAYAYWSPLVYALRGYDKPEFDFRVQTIRILVAVPAVVLLTMEFGLLGTTIGFILTHLTPLVASIYYARQTFSGLEFPWRIQHQVVGGIALAVSVWVAQQVVLPPVTLTRVGALVALGGVVYTLVLYVRCPVMRGGFWATVEDVRSLRA